MINEYNREDVQRERKGRKRAYWIMVAAVVACVFLWRDGAVKTERLAAYQSRVVEQDKSIEFMQQQGQDIKTLLRKEQAIGGSNEVQAHQWKAKAEYWEKESARFEKKFKSEQGKRGPMQRKINERQNHICHIEQLLRDNGVRLYMDKRCGPKS